MAPSSYGDEDDEISEKRRGRGRSEAPNSDRTTPPPPPAGPLISGTVVKVFQEKGFGFLRPKEGQPAAIREDGQKDWFFHRSGCVGKSVGFVALAEGDPVEWIAGLDRDGRIRAEQVRKV